MEAYRHTGGIQIDEWSCTDVLGPYRHMGDVWVYINIKVVCRCMGHTGIQGTYR